MKPLTVTMKLFIPVLFILVTLSLPASARDSVLDIQSVTSNSGVEAWLVEDHSVPVIALKFAFKGAGAKHDPQDKQGLARMASNTMDEGAGDLDSQQFQEELRNLSINLTFNSSRDHFGGHLKTLSINKDRAFELLELALTAPRFDDEPVERMRKANQSRIRSALSDAGWITARITNDVIFAGHPYAQNSGGTLSTLDNITPDDLREFVKTLSRDKLVVAAAGDITPDELKTILDELFGSLPATSPEGEIEDIALQNQGKTFLYKKDIPQTIIEITQPGIERHAPEFQTAQIMNFILGSSGFGSRLTKEIREKRGLTYGVHTYLSNADHIDTYGVSTSTKNENVKEILSLINQEWEKMAATPVTPEELQAAQTYLIGSVPLSLTSTDQIAGLLVSLQTDGMPIDYLDQRQSAIEQTTIEDVQNLAKSLLDHKTFVTVLVGQPEDIENADIIETLPNVE